MKFFGLYSAGTPVPPGGPCPKSFGKTGVLIFFSLAFSPPSALLPGKHNVNPVTGCTGYNPAALTLTTAPSGGVPPYAYQWQLNNNPIAGETQSAFDPPQLTAAGSYSYNCAVTDAGGATVYTAAKLITIVPDPGVEISGGEAVCQYSSVSLLSCITDGTGTYAFQWESGPSAGGPWTPVPGANSATCSPVSSAVGTVYYRLFVNPSTGSCNNVTSLPLAVTVNPLPVTSAIFHY